MRRRFLIVLAPVLVGWFTLLVPAAAEAQVQVTPNFSLTPTKIVTPWVYQMAIATVIIGALVVIGLAVSYMRFAPSFFGRKDAPPRQAPGSRSGMMTQAQRVGRAPAGATRPAVASSPSRTGVAVAERPAPAAAPAEAAPAAAAPAAAVASEPAAAEVSPAPTAGPMSEPAVEADAVGEAETRAPEARPSAKTPEEVGEAPEMAAAGTQAEPTDVETPAKVEEAAPAAAPAASGGHATMDQETFDRVLEEQLGKGVDRRVAEGRARAAAVVAARKKAQG